MTFTANIFSALKPRKILNFMLTAGLMMVAIQLIKLSGYNIYGQNLRFSTRFQVQNYEHHASSKRIQSHKRTITVEHNVPVKMQLPKHDQSMQLPKKVAELGPVGNATALKSAVEVEHMAPFAPVAKVESIVSANKFEIESAGKLVKLMEPVSKVGPAGKTGTGEYMKPAPKERPAANNGPIKVLFLTYNRGGSSFLGELVNRHPDGFYFFEPLFGVYSHLYGLPYGMDQERLFTFKNGSKERFPTEYEAAFVARHLHDVLSCSLDRLPVEVLLPPFRFAEELKRSNFIRCLGYDSVNTTKIPNRQRKRRKWHPLRFPHRCKSFIGKECQKAFNENVEYSCFRKIFGKEHPNVGSRIDNSYLNVSSRNYEKVYDKYLPLRVDQSWLSDNKNFSSHNQCLSNMTLRTDKCLFALKFPCKKSTIIGAKVIRMRMENVAYLLALDPSIKIVHYLRDPRGMLLSRFRQSTRPEKNMKLASKDLCKKMLQDVKARIELEKMYSNNFMVLRYEELATDPMNSLESVYSFLNADIPSKLRNWLYNSTHYMVKSANMSRQDRKRLNLMGTSRINSTITAYKWRDQVRPSTIEYVTNICKKFLNIMNYPL